jgi:hypothetical protein
MSVTSKPKSPPVIDLTSTGVDVLSPAPDDTDIVIAGTPLHFRLKLSITGLPFVVAMYLNEPVEIRHHIVQFETGARKTLGPFKFTTPATVAAAASFHFDTGPFTTSLNGGGGVFETAAGDDDALYQVVTEMHFTASSAANPNCVFDERNLAVTAP